MQVLDYMMREPLSLKDPIPSIERMRDIRWGLNLRMSKIYFCERDFMKRKIVCNANLLLTEIYRENHNFKRP